MGATLAVTPELGTSIEVHTPAGDLLTGVFENRLRGVRIS